MPNIAHMYYTTIDDNMLVTCVHSLRQVCPSVHIVITTDNLSPKVAALLNSRYSVELDWVPPNQMRDRRATCKIERLCHLADVHCVDEQVILVSDVDVVFLQDPFTAMEGEEEEIDIGVTTRGYKHFFPINAGIFYIRRHCDTVAWLKWHVAQILHPTWEPYVEHRRRCHHEHYGLDWSVGQDFLITCWMNRQHLYQKHKLQMGDVGPFYNYCPPTDTMGAKAFEMAWEALEKRDKAVLHLKSKLKEMIYDKRFPDAQLLYPRGKTAWL